MDISELLTRPHDMNPGRVAPYLEDFAAQMASVGHTSFTIIGYLDSAIHFGGWAEATGLDFADINEDTIKAFGAHRCECPGRRSHKHLSRAYTARVQRFVDFLRQHGPAATHYLENSPSIDLKKEALRVRLKRKNSIDSPTNNSSVAKNVFP